MKKGYIKERFRVVYIEISHCFDLRVSPVRPTMSRPDDRESGLNKMAVDTGNGYLMQLFMQDK